MTAAVLVVREPDNFSRILADAGFRVVNCAATQTVETERAKDLGKLILENEYDGYFITSRRAAEIFRREAGAPPGRVYVLGPSSFEILTDNGLDLSFAATSNTARQMVDAIPVDELRNKRFLFVRGNKSLGTIGSSIREFATLDELVVYRTEKTTIDAATLGERFAAACFFSPSAAESFLAQGGRTALDGAKVAAIGPTTADFLELAGVGVDFVPSRASADQFAEQLVGFLGK